MEVVTPVLSTAATTDPHIESFLTTAAVQTRPGETDDPAALYLHTSPEFPMKRLLCAGSGDIYQICTVFRREESGRLNPEFQLLEWYRCGFDHHRLIQEVEQVVRGCWQALNVATPCPGFNTLRYYDAVQSATGIERSALSAAGISQFLESRHIDCPLQVEGEAADSLDTWLDFLMSVVVAPAFDENSFTFLVDYPPSQAALSRIVDAEDGAVAARFELFFGANELANGFHELADADEQRRRFENDRAERARLGLPLVPLDEHLLNALAHGLPDCAGVAMGIDRLLMVLGDAARIDDVVNFPADRA